jgi:hypothetical protein
MDEDAERKGGAESLHVTGVHAELGRSESASPPVWTIAGLGVVRDWVDQGGPARPLARRVTKFVACPVLLELLTNSARRVGTCGGIFPRFRSPT